MSAICIWPDLTWCNIDDIDEYSWKSDDYITINTVMCAEDIEAMLPLIKFPVNNNLVLCDCARTCLRECSVKVPIEWMSLDENSIYHDPGSCWHNEHSDGKYHEASIIPHK
jgi:hypothetical protein